jgi:outer membrane protein assembly factor BamB
MLCAVIALALSTASGETAPGETARGETARDILTATGVKGGLVVHVGCGDGNLTAALRAGDRYLVHGLDADPANVENARRRIADRGLYGAAAVDRLPGKRLPYIDNIVNLLVAEDLAAVPVDEVMRVLAPGGVAYLRIGAVWRKTVKPWPDDIDQWTHYLHGPDNNAVAHDTVVGPPRHMQWTAGPQWTRSHHRLNSISSVVTAKGRLFSILDEATPANINVPGKWVIVARDAFSGVRLWKKPLQSWVWHQVRFRSGPPQVTRLLVASGDRLYAPLGLGAPISAIDAATGNTLKTFENTAGAEEIIVVGGTVLVLKGSPVAEHAVGHAAFRKQYEVPNRKAIVAIDAETGTRLWEWSNADLNPMPETLASDGNKVYIQVDQRVACLDLKSGQELWVYGEPGKKTKRTGVTYGRNTLVVADDVVLCKLSGNLTALSAADGRKLWECPAGGGFHSPLDVFVIDGLVWQGLHVSDSVSPPPIHDFNEGRDLHTGQIKQTNAVAVDLQTSGHHHRCYREKATSRFIITGKRGFEMMELAGDGHSRNNWVRGTCQYGILPANGLLYAPPHACGCYMESKLWGFWALAPDRSPAADSQHKVPEEMRLEKGPAYGQIAEAGSENAESWPMYRHDPLRSGVAETVVPAKLKRAWRARLGGRLTQPVVAEGKVVLAGVDANAVYALDEKSGNLLWKYIAGGRVDSPPSIYKGTVLFGSADGRVYCLRLSDGRLVWRFLAAPDDVRAVAFDQVESLWPVHGSVLVLRNVAYCCAGRSTWLDGGIDLYGLDPATGKVLYKTRFQSKHPEFQEGKEKARKEHQTRVDQNTTDYKTFFAPDRSDAFSMAGGAVSDVLVSDGKNVFLHHVKFDETLQRQDEMSRHLFSTSSLLDDSESHRSHWVLGTGDFSRIPVAYSWIVNRPGKRMPTIAVPTGIMMVYDDHAIWGTRNQGDANGKYHLFKSRNRPFSDDEKPLPDFRKIPASKVNQYVWKNDLPVRTTAMLKSGNNLYLGVTPIEIAADDPHAAYEGRSGAVVWVCSEEDGRKVAQYKLESPVVWDGMAAAGEKLFVSTSHGSLVCFAPAR